MRFLTKLASSVNFAQFQGLSRLDRFYRVAIQIELPLPFYKQMPQKTTNLPWWPERLNSTYANAVVATRQRLTAYPVTDAWRFCPQAGNKKIFAGFPKIG